MKAIPYHLYLEQPLLATSLSGDPNSSLSFPYVPGSLIRGWCIQHYRKQRHDTASEQTDRNDLVGDIVAQRLFFNGQTRYLHAYPLNSDERRCVPTPLSLYQRKYNRNQDAFNESHLDWNEETIQNVTNQDADELERVSEPFCTLRNGQLLLYKPRYDVQVHVQRDSVKGHATKENGEIFHYAALAAGQWFSGVILVDGDEDGEMLHTLLPTSPLSCWLGRSRSSHYGHTVLHVQDIDEAWREIPDALNCNPDEGLWTLTLLSDALLYSETGSPLLHIDEQFLEHHLKVNVTIDWRRTFIDTTRHGGFNRTWKLPLPQQYAIRAGSVIAFTPQQKLEQSVVTNLEEQGIGMRRAEGFGRIIFNWCTERNYSTREGKPKKSSSSARRQPNHLSSESQKLAHRMANRLLEQKIDREITQFILNHVVPKMEPHDMMPENSQLARLNTLVRQALPTHDVDQVSRRFQQFKDTSKHQFEKARLEDTTLKNWIEQLLNNPAEVWEKIGCDTQKPEIAGCTPEASDALTQKTALRLLKAVLSAPPQQRKRRERSVS